MKNIIVLFLFLSTAVSLNAKKFANSYLEFDIPETWNCKPEGGQHVCQPIQSQRRREAIIVMASKIKGPGDSLSEYQKRLGQTKTVTDLKGKKLSSKINYTKIINLAGTPWIESEQLGSEVPEFVTKYLATVEKNIAIAVTFSAHESVFKAYSTDFMTMIQSIHIRKDIPALQKLARQQQEPTLGPVKTEVGATGDNQKQGAKAGDQATGDRKILTGFDEASGAEHKKDYTVPIVIGLAVIIILYLLIRRKKH
jgi:hypothetical protein